MASKSKPSKHIKSEHLVISDQNGKVSASMKTENAKNKYVTDRPPFNLDTKIDYDDDYLKEDPIPMTKSGSKKRRNPESNKHKQQLHQDELNRQWAESLREEFHQKS
uniref:Pre-mRNA-splicing factor CWC26 n=1 Tax=Panagrellus redivivus TaxID=6233 RepID=A0A7E4UXD3_PANRE